MKKNSLLIIAITMSFLLLPVIGQARAILGYLDYRNRQRKGKDHGK